MIEVSPGSRFAIYYAPPRSSSWWAKGCAWLGRDPEAGAAPPPPPPEPPGLTRPVADLTVAPRLYGWHGTLVAPFRLAAGVAAADLLENARSWTLSQRRFEVVVQAAALDRFIAIRPLGKTADARLRALAADALRHFAPTTAAPSPQELERRLRAPLTACQRALLAQWGYPFVLDEFRFHMTLTDALDDPSARQRVIDWWREEIRLLGPLPIDGAAVFVQHGPAAPFILWRRLPFGGEASFA